MLRLSASFANCATFTPRSPIHYLLKSIAFQSCFVSNIFTKLNLRELQLQASKRYSYVECYLLYNPRYSRLQTDLLANKLTALNKWIERVRRAINQLPDETFHSSSEQTSLLVADLCLSSWLHICCIGSFSHRQFTVSGLC